MNAPARERLLVLIVDDSDLQVRQEQELLADQPFDFIVAHNGLEAVAAARRFHPDVILLDLEMPLMNGFEAVASLRSHVDTHATPVIMVTSHGEAGPMENAFVTGCNDFVRKPVHRDELLAKIVSLTGFPAAAPGP